MSFRACFWLSLFAKTIIYFNMVIYFECLENTIFALGMAHFGNLYKSIFWSSDMWWLVHGKWQGPAFGNRHIDVNKCPFHYQAECYVHQSL